MPLATLGARLEREPPRYNTSEHRDSNESREKNKHLFNGLALVVVALSFRSYLDSIVVQNGGGYPARRIVAAAQLAAANARAC